MLSARQVHASGDIVVIPYCINCSPFSPVTIAKCPVFQIGLLLTTTFPPSLPNPASRAQLSNLIPASGCDCISRMKLVALPQWCLTEGRSGFKESTTCGLDSLHAAIPPGLQSGRTPSAQLRSPGYVLGLDVNARCRRSYQPMLGDSLHRQTRRIDWALRERSLCFGDDAWCVVDTYGFALWRKLCEI